MNESALIAAAKEGDREAFNELVIHYQSMAYNVAYRVLGDTDTAADATQEAFLSAYNGISGFRGGSFKAWLLRIVTNACYDYLRGKKRRPTFSLEADPDEDGDWQEWLADPGERPEDLVERRDLGRIIQLGLETLPPDQRTVLVLSDIQGLQYNEIAEILKVSLGTVKSRLNRGRGKLRDYLVEHAELLPSRYRLHDEASVVGGLASLFSECKFDSVIIRLLERGVDRYDN